MSEFVSTFLPPLAAQALVRAAAAARMCEEGSIRRVLIVDKAIRAVRTDYPQYFRTEGSDVHASNRKR